MLKKIIITTLATTVTILAYSQPYLPLAGGTLTGLLEGTNAKFSGAAEVTNQFGILGASGGYTTGDNPSLSFGPRAATGTFATIGTPYGDKMIFSSYHGYSFKTSRSTSSAIDALTIDVNGDTFLAGKITGNSATFSGLIVNNPPNSAFLTANESSGTALSYGYVSNGNTGLQYGIEGSVPGSFCNGTTQYAAIINANYNRNLEFATNNIIRFRIGNDGTANFLGGLSGTSAIFKIDNLSALGGQVSIVNGHGNQNGEVRLNLNNAGAVSWIKGIVTGANINGGSSMAFGVPSSNTDGIERMRIDANGNVGIGTHNPDSKLTVAGKIHSQEVKVSIDAGADFVFSKNYSLKPLTEVAEYISANKHLPEIASADDMKKNGLELGEMNVKLLQKIEELTLYMIDFKKEMEIVKQKNQQLEDKVLKRITSK